MSEDIKEPIQTTPGDQYKGTDFYFTFLFWLKIFFGLVGGVSYYYLIRILFHTGFFDVYYLFRGLLIIGVLIIYLLVINILIVFIMYQLKRKMGRLTPPNISKWRFSLRFSVIFLIVFLISASIMLYIGI
jgi:hypothetical protein